MPTKSHAVLLGLLLTAPLTAQTFYVPSNTPSVGTCNVFPLGTTGAFTYQVIVSAAQLTAGQITGLAFAPCNSTTATYTNFEMRMAHTSSPVSTTFAANLQNPAGGAVVTSQPSLTWNALANTWSPITVTNPFFFNGIDDLVIQIVKDSAVGATSCHRDSNTPRVYNNGVANAVSGNTDLAALKMRIDITAGSNFASLTPFGDGCNEGYASFYENGPFDLSGTSLGMIDTGSGYVVLPGTTAVATPSAAPTAMGDDQVLSFALGWTLPYPGGTTTDLWVSSNGFLYFANSTNNGCCSANVGTFLSGGPRVSAVWRDLNPSAGGTVTFETDTVNGTATVTFDQVPNFSGGAPNTFQYAFDSTGFVELRFGSCDPTAALVGWSPGLGNADPGSIDISATPVILTQTNDVVPLLLTADARPVLGTTINLTVDNVPAGSAIGAVIYGLTKHDPGIDLTSIGMPGCFQFCSQEAVLLAIAPGTSFSSAWVIPPSTAFAGVHVQAQGAIYDPAGSHNALNALSSNGVDFGLDVN